MHPWLATWGSAIAITELKTAMAISFVEAAARFAHNAITISGARRLEQRGAELVFFDLATDAPQRPHVDIRRTEPVAVLFSETGTMPLILALREDFPDTEHQQLVPDGFPSGLCVDDRPWSEARLGWTPAETIERLSLWFHRASRGELHDSFQPLDPFFGRSAYSFVFPRSALREGLSAELAFIAGSSDASTLVAAPLEKLRPGVTGFVTIAYRVPAERMRRLRNAPTTLGSLARVLESRGIDIVGDLRERMKLWSGSEAKHAGRLAGALAVIVEFPVVSPRDQLVGGIDTRAFVPSCTLGELGVALGTLFAARKDEGSRSGYAQVLFPGPAQPALLDAIRLADADVHIEFDRERAAELAGLSQPDHRRTLLIGAGAIGSQVAMVLAREGRFIWTIADDDKLLPHNLARHSLDHRHLALPKAAGLAAQIDELFAADPVRKSEAIICNILDPADHGPALHAAMAATDVILDATASVAAARHLSDHDSTKRRASLFFNPAGDSVVALVEPEDRHLTLRDLEALYYRAILREPALSNHLAPPGDRIAYTGACRALTNRIPQHRAALLSSLVAGGLAEALSTPEPYAGIWSLGSGGAVAHTTPALAPVDRIRVSGWTITIDNGLKAEILAIRAGRLPAETGGILLGVVDALARKIHLVEALPAPEDSVEEGGGFERGIVGVEDAIRSSMRRTMDQVRYVGEWHSHPPKFSTAPSIVDLKQMLWLAGVLEMEDRPALMLIAGDADLRILGGEIV